MLHQMGGCCGLLNDRPIGCQRSPEYGDAALWENWISGSFDDLLPPISRGSINIVAERLAGDRQVICRKLLTDLTHNRCSAARVVQVSHIVLAGWFEIDQYWNFIRELIERV